MEKRRPETGWHGFAAEIGPKTELVGGVLIAEFETGAYEPVAEVSTLNEAREIAQFDAMLRRERGSTRVTYKLWARGLQGRYLTVPIVIGS